MKQIEVVAAIICEEGKIFATQRGTVNGKTVGSFLLEKWRLEKYLRKH